MIAGARRWLVTGRSVREYEAALLSFDEGATVAWGWVPVGEKATRENAVLHEPALTLRLFETLQLAMVAMTRDARLEARSREAADGGVP